MESAKCITGNPAKSALLGGGLRVWTLTFACDHPISDGATQGADEAVLNVGELSGGGGADSVDDD